MTVVLLIVHGLMAVALLGALTHQAVGLWPLKGAPTGFAGRYVRSRGDSFTNAIIVLFIVTMALGAYIYPTYRIDVRIALEEMQMPKTVGAFDLKEHLAAIGLGMLPLYKVLWADGDRVSRNVVTLLLAAIVWWNFLVGHVLNNLRGLT